MKSLLKKCGALAAILIAMSLVTAAPALAVKTGEVTPKLVVQATGKYNYEVTWGGNMTGWSRGTLTIEGKFYVDGSQYGEPRGTKCLKSTYCTLADTTLNFSTAKGWEVKVTGCGPGGCVTESKSA